MQAYARLQDNEYPNTSLDLTDKEWETLYFETYTLDHDNKYDFPEECYNMMLVHPLTSQVFWGYSADFEWGERPPRATREMVMDYFRFHWDKDELTTDDYQEIALNCAYNEFVNQGIAEVFRKDNECEDNDV